MRILPFPKLTFSLVAFGAILSGGPLMGATLATFEFTSGSLSPTLGSLATDNGITISTLSGPTGVDYTDGDADLEGVKDANNIAVQGEDTSYSGTGSATTNADYMSLTITIPNGVVVNLDSITLDVGGVDIYTTGSVNGAVARLFSSIDGFDSVVDDTIGRLGYVGASGDHAIANVTVDLNTLSNNINNGANISAGDFDGLTDTAVTFYMPWIDNSSAASRAVILDNIVINATLVPEPSIALLGALGVFGLLRRRRA